MVSGEGATGGVSGEDEVRWVVERERPDSGGAGTLALRTLSVGTEPVAGERPVCRFGG